MSATKQKEDFYCYTNINISLVKEEGLRKLWQGLPPAILRHIGKIQLFLVCYGGLDSIAHVTIACFIEFLPRRNQ